VYNNLTFPTFKEYVRALLTNAEVVDAKQSSRIPWGGNPIGELVEDFEQTSPYPSPKKIEFTKLAETYAFSPVG
jgi:hypothetical protein